jgi:UDP-perosamine 4-acetyltransferase
MSAAIVVVGAGGHAKVCIELLRAMGEQVAYCIGTDPAVEQCLGVPVLQGDDNLQSLYEQGYRRAFIALGPNRLRAKLAGRAQAIGYTLVQAISPHAVLSPSATIGAGVAIMAGAVVNADAVIGELAIINTGTSVDHDCRIGKGAHLAPQCALAGGVDVGEGTFLGVGCKVIPGIVIGDHAIIGAGAVVITDIEADQTAVGVPARPRSAQRT